MLNFDWLVKFVVRNHVSGGLLNVLYLVELYQKNIVQFVEVLLHFILSYSQGDFTRQALDFVFYPSVVTAHF